MKIYAGFPIEAMGQLITCPECRRDSAWIPVLDLKDEEITVACNSGSCQATVRKEKEYGEDFDSRLASPTEVYILIEK